MRAGAPDWIGPNDNFVSDSNIVALGIDTHIQLDIIVVMVGSYGARIDNMVLLSTITGYLERHAFQHLPHKAAIRAPNNCCFRLQHTTTGIESMYEQGVSRIDILL